MISLDAGGAIAQYLASWACAGAVTIATPPSGPQRAAWVSSLAKDKAAGLEADWLTGAPATGTFTAFRSSGVLASSTTLQWISPPMMVERATVVRPARLESLPDFVEPRYRDMFRRWADGLRLIDRAPLAYIEQCSMGFPAPGLGHSLRCDYTVRTVNGAPSFEPVFTVSGGLDASRFTPYSTPRPGLVLPLLPRWPEFIINTAFWAGVLWLVFGGAAWLRGLWRIRQGRCAACGYDLRGLAPRSTCPECGGSPEIYRPTPA